MLPRRTDEAKTPSGSRNSSSMSGDDEAKVIAKWLEYRETDQAALIEQMNERYAVVPIAGKVRVMTFDSVRRPDGQNQRLVATFYGLDDFRALLAHQKITVTGSDGKSKTIGRSAWWARSSRPPPIRGD